jgi:hypothetical protein
MATAAQLNAARDVEPEPVALLRGGEEISVYTVDSIAFITWTCGEEYEFDLANLNDVLASLEGMRSLPFYGSIPLEEHVGDYQFATLDKDDPAIRATGRSASPSSRRRWRPRRRTRRRR